MAFFDDLGKKFSQVGQTAVQKTKEMSDISKINGLISDEEKKINNNYHQIGKLYVEIHNNNFEKDFADMITAIHESETKIRDYKLQIQTIKGILRCENCGAEVPNNVSFCSSCGTKILKPVQNTTENNIIKCIGCGVTIDKNARFCTSCGKPIADTIMANESMFNSDHTFGMGTKKCPNCGTESADDMFFCTECGTKLN